MASTVEALIAANPEAGKRIRVINKTVEAVDLKTDLNSSKVDVLISEPIGTFLFNERMIETYLFARDVFLRPGGKPTMLFKRGDSRVLFNGGFALHR